MEDMISVKDLTFTYAGGGAPALRRISLDIQKGEIFGLLGPSGAGKSTAQKILIRLLRDYGGAVQVFGRDLSSWGQEFYQRVGVSFEVPNHYLKLTALENLSYFASLYARETEDPAHLLDQVGLKEDGEKRVGQFSKGMRIRLNVARSLLHRPDLLFLDEPTSGLDPVSAQRIKDLIRRQKEAGRTVFLTTHNMIAADELCDRVAFLVDGEIKLIDNPRSLKLTYGKRLVRVEYASGEGLQRREFPLDELGENTMFIDLLRQNRIETIHTLETTLENIFIEVTGRSLT